MTSPEQRYAAFAEVADRHNITLETAVDEVVKDCLQKARTTREEAISRKREYDKDDWAGAPAMAARIVAESYARAMRNYRDAAHLLATHVCASKNERALVRLWELVALCVKIAPLAFHQANDSFWNERGTSETIGIIQQAVWVTHQVPICEDSTVDAIRQGIEALCGLDLSADHDSVWPRIATLGDLVGWIKEHAQDEVFAPLVQRLPMMRSQILYNSAANMARWIRKTQSRASAQHRGGENPWETWVTNAYEMAVDELFRLLQYRAYLEGVGVVAPGYEEITRRILVGKALLDAMWPKYHEATQTAPDRAAPAESLEQWFRIKGMSGRPVPEEVRIFT